MSKQVGITLDGRKLKKLLTLNLYSKKETCIREIASNALDSKRRSGSSKPIFITYNSGTGIFSCKDYGLGMTVEDFEKKICIVGESDKEWNKAGSDDIEIGKYGVGSLSWRSLTDRCKWICIKDGKKFEGEIWEENEELDYDVSDVEECSNDEENSVEVQLEVPYSYKQDFIKWLKQELAYFPDIFWNINGDFSWNKLKVYEGEHFKVSELSDNKYMHICLDDVVYNIEWGKLDIEPIEANVGIKFKISDGIEPSITRETLSYDDDFQDTLGERINNIATLIVENYNKYFDKEHPIEEIFSNYRAAKSGFIHGMQIKMQEISSYSAVKMKNYWIKEVDDKLLNDFVSSKDWFLTQYKYEGVISHKTFTTKGYIYDLCGSVLNEEKVIALERDEKLSKVKIEYIKTLYAKVVIMRKSSELSLDIRNRKAYGYYSLLGLHKVPRSEWRGRIQQHQIVEGRIEEKLINWKDIVPSDEFLKGRKAKYESRAINKQLGDVTLKISRHLDRSTSDFSCKFEPTLVKIAELHKQKKLFIYATEKERCQLDGLYREFLMGKHTTSSKRPSNVEVCIIGERDQKHVKVLHNFKTIEQFMEGNNQPFRRFCTATLIEEVVDKNKLVFKYKDFVQKLNSTFSEKLKTLEEYKTKYAGHVYNNELLKKNMLQIFEENKWWTEEYYLLKEVEKEIGIYDFIPHLEKSIEEGSSYNRVKREFIPDEALPLAREILLNRKRRYDVAKDVSKELIQSN